MCPGCTPPQHVAAVAAVDGVDEAAEAAEEAAAAGSIVAVAGRAVLEAAGRSSACCLGRDGVRGPQLPCNSASDTARAKSSEYSTARVWGDIHLLYLVCRYRKGRSMCSEAEG